MNIVDALSASHAICSIGLDCEWTRPVKLGDCNESQRLSFQVSIPLELKCISYKIPQAIT